MGGEGALAVTCLKRHVLVDGGTDDWVEGEVEEGGRGPPNKTSWRRPCLNVIYSIQFWLPFNFVYN